MYVHSSGGTITLNADGTVVATYKGESLNGTYTVSGNTVTLTSTDGIVDTATVENGVMTLEDGSQLTKQ